MPWIDSRASLLNRKQQQKTQYVKKIWRGKMASKTQDSQRPTKMAIARFGIQNVRIFPFIFNL